MWGLHCWQLLVSKAVWMQTCQLSTGFSLPRQWKEPKCLAPVSVSQTTGTGCHESTVCRQHLSSLYWTGAQLSHTYQTLACTRSFMKCMPTSQCLQVKVQDSRHRCDANTAAQSCALCPPSCSPQPGAHLASSLLPCCGWLCPDWQLSHQSRGSLSTSPASMDSTFPSAPSEVEYIY